MSVRHLVSATLLVLGPLLAAPAGAQGTEYAAGTTRYRLTSTTTGSQSSPMGSQDFTLEARQQLTVNLSRRGGDTIVANVTIDSIVLKSATVAPDVSKLVGTRVVSLLSPTGKLYSFRTDSAGHPMLSQVTDAVSRFLPTFRRDLKTGLAWTDTTTGKVTQQGVELDRTVIASYAVLGDSSVAGEQAWQIERKATVKAAGSGMAQGQPVALESVTTSTSRFLLTPKGVYLGGRQSDDTAVKVSILAQNIDINIKQASKTQVDVIH